MGGEVAAATVQFGKRSNNRPVQYGERPSAAAIIRRFFAAILQTFLAILQRP
jgi:hypothetical protein